MWRLTFTIAFLGLVAPSLLGAERDPTEFRSPTTAPADAVSHTWLLHLPGIGGEMEIDRDLVAGFKDGGWAGPIDIYDWTENDPGLDALMARKRNEREAETVAKWIEDKVRKDPQLHVTITSHSAGTGIAVWALEKLPDDVKVDAWVMLASALSPDYDLSKAMKHVRGKVHNFYSPNDTIVLGAGTTMFGTIDGKKTAAAGLVGFKTPPDEEKAAYSNLVQRPWVKKYLAFENAGTHIGYMARPWVSHVLAPLLIDPRSDKSNVVVLPATQPDKP
jgi:pimeloyl-ACP methyl ester carboxylesterase